MKKNSYMLTTVLTLLLNLSACGGGGSTSNNQGSTNSISPKLLNTAGELINICTSAASEINMVLTGSIIFDWINCESNSTPENFNCTLTNSKGERCQVTGLQVEGPPANFQITMDCTNFTSLYGDEVTIINGSYTCTWPVTSASMNLEEHFLSNKAVGMFNQCYIEDVCTQDERTCSSASENLFSNYSVTVGSNKLTVTDECGTSEFTAGSEFEMLWCIAEDMRTYIITLSATGTFDSLVADGDNTFACSNRLY